MRGETSVDMKVRIIYRRERESEMRGVRAECERECHEMPRPRGEMSEEGSRGTRE